MTKFYFQKDILDSDELKPKPQKRLRYSLFLPKNWELVGLYTLVVAGALAFMTAILFLYSVFNPFFLKGLMDFIFIIIVFFLLLVPLMHFGRFQELQVSNITVDKYGTKVLKEFIQFNYVTLVLASLKVIPSIFGICYHFYMAYFNPNHFNIQTVTYLIVLIFFFFASLPEAILYIYCIRFCSKQIPKN